MSIDFGSDPYGVRRHQFEQLRDKPDYDEPDRERAPYPLLTFDALLSLPEPSWLIDGFMPEGLAVLFGAPSTFKSFVALDLALHVATGLPWHGRDVQAGHVVYVAAEGSSGLGKRAQARWREHDRPEMDRIHFLTRSIDLLDADAVRRLADSLDELPGPDVRRLVVIDTFARSMVGDENSARDVGQVVRALGEVPALTTLVVHHASKEGSTERGSSALRGAADVMVRVERDGQAPRLQLACDKAPKDGEAWPTMTLASRPVGDSLVLDLVPIFSAAADAEKELRERILAFVAEHGPVSKNKVEQGVGGRRGRVRGVLEQMFIEGLIDRDQKGQTISYFLPRPSLVGEVGARRAKALEGEPRPEGGEEDVVLPLSGEVDQPAASPRPSTSSRNSRTAATTTAGTTSPTASKASNPRRRSRGSKRKAFQLQVSRLGDPAWTCDTCSALLTDVKGKLVCFRCIRHEGDR